MSETGWKCKQCQRAGTVEYESDADVYSVVLKVERAHGAASPACRLEFKHMRVWPVPLWNTAADPIRVEP